MTERDTALQPQSLFLSFSMSNFRFFPALLYVFLLLSSILFDTLDEVQLCIGHAFLNPGNGAATTTFPFPFPISALFFHLSLPFFLSANGAAPHSLSSGGGCYMELGVCLTLFEIQPLISAFSTPPVILYVFVCCLSSHSLL